MFAEPRANRYNHCFSIDARTAWRGLPQWNRPVSWTLEGMAEQVDRITLTFDAADEYRPEAPPPPEIPAWKDGSTRIGIHTSIVGDISTSLEIAHGLGANALQIFSCSPRMWDRGGMRIAEAEATRFRLRRKELGLGPLVVHDNYLINLASPNPVLRTRSVQAFRTLGKGVWAAGVF